MKGRNIYDPGRLKSAEPIGDEISGDPLENNYDSIAEREQIIRDSILLREQFVRDSLLAREQFVKDSLIRRKEILDSVIYLQKELKILAEAYFRAVKDDIILRCYDIPIIGDSALGDFVYLTLPFGVKDPYSPWKSKIVLTGKAVRFTYDPKQNKINAIHTPQFRAAFKAYDQQQLMVITEMPVIQKNWAGHFYKIPLDSVFFDKNKRITKIKRYMLFHSVINTNQKGNLLFTNCTEVKQFIYGIGHEIEQFQLTRYCERWKAYEANKVCSILTYDFTKKGNAYLLSRRNNPANGYSDGTYTFTFDDNDNLNGISFVNVANTENWHRSIELNKDGNVSCYIDKTNDVIRQSLCMIYHPEPQAKYPVETVTTTFEKDGISYYQKNNMTGKIRTRDKMTLEWSGWKP